MKVLGIVGRSGSGKTTIIARLIGEFAKRGLTISTVKLARDGVDLDKPGKDSYVHRTAGAKEVVLITPSRWALMHELRGSPEPLVGEVIAVMTAVDILLVEGLREEEYECIEIRRTDCADHRHPRKIAIATDDVALFSQLPVLDLNAPNAICDFLLRHWSIG
jgi:molybdopterin-guanine dinucleotide biosynthesis protein MobB